MSNLKELGLQFANTKSERIFNDLYVRIKPGLLNYINSIVKDPDQSEDLFSITMSIVYNKIEQYNPKYHISTWIYRIAYHEALLYLRKKNRRNTTNFSVFESYYENDRVNDKIMFNTTIDEDNYIDEDFQTLEDREFEMENRYNSIIEKIESLDTLYKDIVKDRILNDMSYHDISEKHKLPLHTIKNRISRGKKILQKTCSEMANI